jgi:hypothetical protein
VINSGAFLEIIIMTITFNTATSKKICGISIPAVISKIINNAETTINIAFRILFAAMILER